MISCRCIVEGRVQGVGFRYFTQRNARQMGVRGWVRNLVGGDVEIRVEGGREAVRGFLDRIRQGPAYGRVENLRVEETPAEGFDGFSIEV